MRSCFLALPGGIEAFERISLRSVTLRDLLEGTVRNKKGGGLDVLTVSRP